MRRLSGTLPFYADNPDDFLDLVLSSNFSFPDSEWEEVGEEGAHSTSPTPPTFEKSSRPPVSCSARPYHENSRAGSEEALGCQGDSCVRARPCVCPS